MSEINYNTKGLVNEKPRSYFGKWWSDFVGIFVDEFHHICGDGGALLIFLVAGLVYPLLYHVLYLNGILEETPIAIVDNAACSESRSFIRALDSTREVSVAYKCVNMDEARRLMAGRKVHGIVMFPADYGEKMARRETATLSVYCDMSSFLYYKNCLLSANMVMLKEMARIQIDYYMSDGLTEIEAKALVQALPYEENNPYNAASSYSFFLLTTVLFVILQQTMFYGMSLLVGTMREENRSFASLRDKFQGRGLVRIVLGRGAVYWFLYLIIGIYVSIIVPAIFGMPQRGDFWNIILLLLFFVTDCVFFSMTWSTLINKRETVFVLFLFISPFCLLLAGTCWPVFAFPKFWKLFSYIFPTTFGCQAYVNMSGIGGDLATASTQFLGLTAQTTIYFFLACAAVFVENHLLKNRSKIELRIQRWHARIGYDKAKERRIITGQ